MSPTDKLRRLDPSPPIAWQDDRTFMYIPSVMKKLQMWLCDEYDNLPEPVQQIHSPEFLLYNLALCHGHYEVLPRCKRPRVGPNHRPFTRLAKALEDVYPQLRS